MRFERPLKPACFKARLNRFLGLVDVEGETRGCFIPNPGRLEGILRAGAKVYLSKREAKNRETEYDLLLVDLENTLVSIDSRAPNRVVEEAIGQGLIDELKGLQVKEREAPFQGSRLDFLLRGDGTTLLLEVKSCTLVEDGVALFPDAPTSRGERHIRALARALAHGRSAVLFLVQRGDAAVFRPNWRVDPRLSEALRMAVLEGVEAYAYTSRVSLTSIEIGKGLPVELRPM